MSYKTMKQSQDWKKNYNWTDKNDHPVEDNEFQPKVLKDQVVKFYKKPKTITFNGRKIKSFGVIKGPFYTGHQKEGTNANS